MWDFINAARLDLHGRTWTDCVLSGGTLSEDSPPPPRVYKAGSDFKRRGSERLVPSDRSFSEVSYFFLFLSKYIKLYKQNKTFKFKIEPHSHDISASLWYGRCHIWDRGEQNILFNIYTGAYIMIQIFHFPVFCTIFKNLVTLYVAMLSQKKKIYQPTIVIDVNLNRFIIRLSYIDHSKP